MQGKNKEVFGARFSVAYLNPVRFLHGVDFAILAQRGMEKKAQNGANLKVKP